MASGLPPNAHVSSHACLRVKLSQLRSNSTSANEVKTLVNEVATIVSCEALSNLEIVVTEQDQSPLGYAFSVEKLAIARISIMPILRSGLAMLDAVQTLLPEAVPVHHLGLFRDKSTMSAVEYYNNLPYHRPTASNPSAGGPSELAILIDPVIATGATACAAIDTLREWGVKKIIMICVMASRAGLCRAAEQWEDGVEIWAAGMDEGCDENGMIKPGLGDIGDRLYLTLGK